MREIQLLDSNRNVQYEISLGRKARNNTVVKKKTLTFGPTKPLKVFNWAKLPDAKAANSIWKDVDEIEVSSLVSLHCWLHSGN